jgi:1-acyl-sn-glycerol-3-phosphate acyltransferase
MEKTHNYSDIAPYFDNDLQPVLKKLIAEPAFLKLAQSVNADISAELLKAQAQNVHTIHDFQLRFIAPLVKSILKNSVDNLTFSGLENLKKEEAYLFISNHRDILLDSTLLNYILLQNGFSSTQMAIGDNLLIEPWISDFFKLNKSFIVKRGLPGREFLQFSKRLSNYIAYTLQERKESIWIAQREGRTKNGIDETQQGLLKMLTMAESKNFKNFIISLNIVPVAISYQYESCDKLKAKENYKRQFENFKKSPKADLYSMISGIRGHKGNVHISVGKPLNDELQLLDSHLQKNDFLKATAELIDNKIFDLYKIWNNNYIAWDILNNTNRFADFYTNEEKEHFENYIEKLTEINSKLRPFLLQIYAGPVENCRL